MGNKKALVVFSGGQDSTTCLVWAKRTFEEVYAVSFDYGQRHKIELDCAEKIAQLQHVPLEILKLSSFDRLGDNSLTGDQEVLLSKSGLPNTFVAGRNLIFLTYASAYAYSRGITNIVGGMSQTDYSGYPDCRKTTLDALMNAINLGMETELVLHTPLMELTKAESVRLAVEIDALDALSFSHTCYNGAIPPCQNCSACHLRAKGFDESAIVDPLLDRLRN